MSLQRFSYGHEFPVFAVRGSELKPIQDAVVKVHGVLSPDEWGGQFILSIDVPEKMFDNRTQVVFDIQAFYDDLSKFGYFVVDGLNDPDTADSLKFVKHDPVTNQWKKVHLDRFIDGLEGVYLNLPNNKNQPTQAVGLLMAAYDKDEGRFVNVATHLISRVVSKKISRGLV